MNKKVIYTCLVGNYDELLQPLVVDESFDYICFSNDIKEEKVGVWQIRPIPYSCKDNARLSRFVKILPHKVLSEYDWSLWMDANIQITGKELYDKFNEKIREGNLVSQVPHLFPPEDCTYDEIRYAYLCGRCGIVTSIKQYCRLKREGFPAHFGLFENNVIFRKHNDGLVVAQSQHWWSEFCKYTKRDQFNLMYIFWKNNYYPDYLFGEKQNSRNVSFLQWREHHTKKIVKETFVQKIDTSIKYHLIILFSNLFDLIDIIYNYSGSKT